MEYQGIMLGNYWLLSLLLVFPLLGALFVYAAPVDKPWQSRAFAIGFSAAAFLQSLALLSGFDSSKPGVRFVDTLSWIPQLGIKMILGIDGLSLWLVILATLLTLLVIIMSGQIKEKLRSYLASVLLLEAGMIGALLALDLVSFYVFWELMLIPMYFLIGIWGGQRRIYAAIKFVLFTAFGSLLMLVAIIYLGVLYQSQFGTLSFALSDLMRLQFSWSEELWLFSAFALAFAIKIPVFPLHTWLPDAHVEAPTGGSVILAGVLLKMGLYGLIRFCLPLFPHASVQAAPLFAVLGIIGIIYGALVAWVQTDMKKLVAYSSVSHLGFCVLGFAALNVIGMQGAILQMINHGISTGALFFLVGVIYDRRHTRLIAEFGGLAAKMPIYAAVFLIITLSSIAVPLTNGFIGEFLILYGAFLSRPVWAVIAVPGVVLGAMYMLSMYRRVFYGPLDEGRNGALKDLSAVERMVLGVLVALVFVIGFYPQPILSSTEPFSRAALEQLAQRSSLPPVR